jgi:hypothetical protein
MSGRPELVFTGSPLTIMVALMLDMISHDLAHELVSSAERSLANSKMFNVEISMLEQIGAVRPCQITETDYEEALSYFKEEPNYGGKPLEPKVLADSHL